MGSSRARRAFDQNCKDVQRLVGIHGDIGGDNPGRRYGVEVLNKSAVVLVTAFWEAYCEDVAAEAIKHLVEHSDDPAKLPKGLRKAVADELEGDKHDLAVWQLAGDGWRQVLSSRLARFQEVRNRKLNTPKSGQIIELFSSTLGIEDISTSWNWQSMSSSQARKKLDRYVELRGSIAHRGASSSSVRMKDVTDYFSHVKKLVGKTGGRVNTHVRRVSGVPLF